MRPGTAIALLISGFLLLAPPVVEAGAIRISQIYPGGGSGNPATPYREQFVEFFNSSASPVDIGGWILAYDGGEPTSSYGCTNCNRLIPANTIVAPCGYLLVRLSLAGLYGAAVPSPDLSLTEARKLSDGAAGIALVSSGNPSGLCLSGPSLEDLVRWGPIGTCYLGTRAPSPGALLALFRREGGMVDTRNNGADFELAAPAPRNSSSPGNAICLATPAAEQSWGRLKVYYR